MNKIFAAALVTSSAILASSAFAQNTTTQPAQPPANGATAMEQDTSAAGSMGMQGGFLTVQQADQMLGSNLMDANVVTAANENIGEVEDLLLDREGRVIGVTVEVGGFLGIGDKEVAIPAQALQFVLAQDAQASAISPAGTTTGAMSGAGGTTTGGAATGTTAVDPNATAAVNSNTAATGDAAMGVQPGTMGMGAGAAGNNAMGTAGTGGYVWGWTGGQIDHIQVDFTREQLEAAPAFESVDN